MSSAQVELVRSLMSTLRRTETLSVMDFDFGNQTVSWLKSFIPEEKIQLSEQHVLCWD